MKKVKVYGKTEICIYQVVEIEDNATIEDIIDKANEEFEGITNYCGNGGVDKLIGVYGDGVGIECNDNEIEFAPDGEGSIEDYEEE